MLRQVKNFLKKPAPVSNIFPKPVFLLQRTIKRLAVFIKKESFFVMKRLS